MAEEPYAALYAAIEKQFGGREGYLAWQIVELSRSQQPCDVTHYETPPAFDVTIDPQISIALMYGAGVQKLQELLNSFKLSDGTRTGFGKIWTINPMPKGGFTDAELAAVNMSEAEELVGPNGETLRQMLRDTYRPASAEEEDRIVRRFIAS